MRSLEKYDWPIKETRGFVMDKRLEMDGYIT